MGSSNYYYKLTAESAAVYRFFYIEVDKSKLKEVSTGF